MITIKDYSKPGIIDLPLAATTDLEIAVLANLITFSPGSMVVGLSADRKFMQVHLFYVDDADHEIAVIQQNLERRVLEVLR